MAEVTRRRQGELLRAVLEILRASPDGRSAKDVIHQVEIDLPPTEFENSTYPDRPGVRRFEKMVRFSTINAVKAGWLIKSKGTWVVTPEGIQALDKYSDAERLYRESILLYREWQKSQPETEGDAEEESDAHPSVTFEEAEETARQEILEYLAKMPPYEFQDLVASLLRAMGYHVAWVAPPGPDKGLDILAYSDPLGATGPRIKVQVKRRADRIGAQELRSFFAVLGSGDVGIFVSLGGFSSDAQAEARQQEIRRLSLIDVDELIELWTDNYESLPAAAQQLLPLRPIYYLSPS